MRRIAAIFIVLLFVCAQAQASTAKGLKAAFDELNYSLQVEWDQKDINFKTQKLNQFTLKVQELQSQGLTQAEMMSVLKAELKNERLAADIQVLLEKVSMNRMSSSEANALMLNLSKDSYSAGASWNSWATVGVVTAAVAIILLVVARVASAQAEKGEDVGYHYTPGIWTCSEVCDEYGCYETCYY